MHWKKTLTIASPPLVNMLPASLEGWIRFANTPVSSCMCTPTRMHPPTCTRMHPRSKPHPPTHKGDVGSGCDHPDGTYCGGCPCGSGYPGGASSKDFPNPLPGNGTDAADNEYRIEDYVRVPTAIAAGEYVTLMPRTLFIFSCHNSRTRMGCPPSTPLKRRSAHSNSVLSVR